MTTTMEPMTAPLGEVLDWLAERDGWQKSVMEDFAWIKRYPELNWTDGIKSHPITLDRLAGMLPPPWQWHFMMFGGDEWDVAAVKPLPLPAEASLRAISEALQQRPCERVEAPTELEARARVVAAVLMRANEPEKPKGKRVFMQTQPDGTMKTIG